MKNMKIPFRPAPSVSDARKKNSNQSRILNIKKKPPPRPPPPNFDKQNKPQCHLNRQSQEMSLIDFDSEPLPNKIISKKTTTFGGSESSSFNSSTNSLASSKTSAEFEEQSDPWELHDILSSNNINISQSKFYITESNQPLTPNISIPTIIRSQPNKQKLTKTIYEHGEREDSPPMPSIPPPSPPKDVAEVVIPYGIALYDFPATHADELSLQVNDIVVLLKEVNKEWMYGRVGDREGMFPTNFISVQLPLTEYSYSTAIYEFSPQVAGDLALKPGQKVRVTGRISSEWLMGESDGQAGQFPANFIDRIPFNV